MFFICLGLWFFILKIEMIYFDFLLIGDGYKLKGVFMNDYIWDNMLLSWVLKRGEEK